MLVTSYQLSHLHETLTYFQKAEQVTEPQNKIHALVAFSPCLNYLSPNSIYVFLTDSSCHNGKNPNEQNPLYLRVSSEVKYFGLITQKE